MAPNPATPTPKPSSRPLSSFRPQTASLPFALTPPPSRSTRAPSSANHVAVRPLRPLSFLSQAPATPPPLSGAQVKGKDLKRVGLSSLQPPSLASPPRDAPDPTPVLPPSPPAPTPRASTPTTPSAACPLVFSTGCVAIDHLFRTPSASRPASAAQTNEEADEAEAEVALLRGVATGQVIEFSGPPGIGKTAFAASMAVRARVRMTCSGKGKETDTSRSVCGEAGDDDDGVEVLLVDTEGSLPRSRIVRSALALLSSHPDLRLLHERTAELVGGIHILRPLDTADMVSLLHSFPEWLRNHPKVKLVVIDTLSFHFRHTSIPFGERARLMDTIRHQLGMTAAIADVAIVAFNQMATKLYAEDGTLANFETGKVAKLVPQLGDSWLPPGSDRVVLFRRGHDRARLACRFSGTIDTIKDSSPWVAFEVDRHGLVCDIEGLS